MTTGLSRRSVLSALAIAPAAGLVGCSTGPTGGSGGPGAAASSPSASARSGGFPVTITHALGQTTIPAEPKRIATVSWMNADIALALGVVPVGMPEDSFGGNAQASTPWKDARLTELGAPWGSTGAPAQYDETAGINMTAIAATSPDLILAAYSGISADEYARLSMIAPVVAYPQGPFATRWQEATRMIGTALGRSAAAAELVTKTETLLSDQAAKHPKLKGATFIYGNINPTATPPINIYTALDNRPRFLMALGMTMAPVAVAATKESQAFFIEWSAERANELVSDVFVTWVATQAAADAIKTDRLLSQIPAVKSGGLVADFDNTLTLAISVSNPLSLPWAIDRFVPTVAAVLE